MKDKTVFIGSLEEPRKPYTSIDPRAASLPNPELTPGAWVAAPQQVVMAPGFARYNRRVTDAIRRAVFARYQLPYAERYRYYIDHVVPLGLGGTNDLSNLWPHSWDAPYNPRMKSRLEERLRALILRGAVSLTQAQEMLALNWTTAYDLYFGAPQNRDACST